MTLHEETIAFLTFVLIGCLFSVIFDFFRAIRKLKKVTTGVVCLQDIIYFILIGIILLIAVLNIRQDVFRLYLILAIILGVVIYLSIVGNFMVKVFFHIFKMSNAIKEFVFLPTKVYMTLFDKEIKKVKKYTAECCKKISYMIKSYQEKTKKIVAKGKKRLKTKEG